MGRADARLAVLEGAWLARQHLDLHRGADGQPIVRAVVLEPRDAVAEGIQILMQETRLRVDLQRMREAPLVSELARRQVQEVMRMGDVTAVFVDGGMADGVARHAVTAFRSKSTCEKCCEVS
jgi:hypothetical protein